MKKSPAGLSKFFPLLGQVEPCSLAAYCFKGWPTAMEQSCPGWPCAGFSFTVDGCVLAAGIAAPWAGTTTGVTVGCAAVFAGALLRGAPTLMSQRCPGWPCAGFSFTPASGLAAVTGCVGVMAGCPDDAGCACCAGSEVSVTGCVAVTGAGLLVCVSAVLLPEFELHAASEAAAIRTKRIFFMAVDLR